MTVSSSTDRATFAGNGVATEFPLPFRFFANGDIQAGLVNDVTLDITPLVLGVDYSLYGAGFPEIDGNPESILTMFVPPVIGFTLFVRRVMAVTQPTDIVNQGRFLPEIHETVFDRLTMLIQQASLSQSRAIRVQEFDPVPSALPSVSGRATKVFGFDAAGNPVASTLSLSALEQQPANAAASAAAASASAFAAAADAAAAAASFDSFDDRYLGAKSSDPALDNDGNALLIGAIYWNTTTNLFRVWKGSVWQDQSNDYLNSLRIDVASATTVNLTTSAPNTRNINITGTTTITGFTVAAEQLYFVRFNAALTLTNNANIVTQSGASITTAAGDTCVLRATAANVVEVLSYAAPYGRYVSPEQTVTAGGTITLSHLLGVMPKFAQAFLICKTAELGYSVGSEVPISMIISASSTFNYQLELSTTTIRAVCGDSGISLVNAVGGASGPTLAKWRLIVRAWA